MPLLGCSIHFAIVSTALCDTVGPVWLFGQTPTVSMIGGRLLSDTVEAVAVRGRIRTRPETPAESAAIC